MTSFDISLRGKRALVGGGSRGLGYASAQLLAELGAEVVLLARNAVRVREAADSLAGAAAGRHRAIAADASDPPRAVQLVREEVAAHGPIQILINNSGGPPGGPVEEATAVQFEAAFRQHLLFTHELTLALVPGMRQSGYGRIVNIISTSVKAPIAGLGVSNTVRAAVANWAKTLATELAPAGITVNNVLPGFAQTDRLTELLTARAAREGRSLDEITAEVTASIPLRRIAQPTEVAAAVAFLASPAASYVTGINLPVDGGRTPSL